MPLIYKLAKSNPDIIIIVQKCFHSLSSFFIVYALLTLIQKGLTKYTLVILIYFFMSWWNILGWTITLLSESLSNSLMFCWIASFIILLKRNDNLSLGFHLIITIIFSFTRDSWPYILLLFYFLYSFYFYLFYLPFFKKTALLLFASMVIFYFQQVSATVGQRYKLPLINNIILRIIPNENYTKWFVEKGLPQADSLKKNFNNINANDESKLRLYRLYKDSTYTHFFNWVATRGKNVYTEFLITHPFYTLFLEESKSNLSRIFVFNLFYTGKFKSYSILSQFVFPIFNIVIVLLLLIILSFKNRNAFYSLPIILFIVFSFNVLLLYNADAMEVERHLYITEIMIQFIGFLCIFNLMEKINLIKK